MNSSISKFMQAALLETGDGQLTEGSGTVVATFMDVPTRDLCGFCHRRDLGRISGHQGDDLYSIAEAAFFGAGAMMMVNPLYALAFFDMIKRGNHAAIVNTAAASALGRMIVRLDRRYHVPIINIVRRQQQVNLLRSFGAGFVLQSNDAYFRRDFQELI